MKEIKFKFINGQVLTTNNISPLNIGTIIEGMVGKKLKSSNEENAECYGEITEVDKSGRVTIQLNKKGDEYVRTNLFPNKSRVGFSISGGYIQPTN